MKEMIDRNNENGPVVKSRVHLKDRLINRFGLKSEYRRLCEAKTIPRPRPRTVRANDIRAEIMQDAKAGILKEQFLPF